MSSFSQKFFQKVKNFKEHISKWWHGKVEAYDSPYIIGLKTKRHWTSNTAHAIWDFYREHWKWIITTFIAVITAWMTL